MSEIRRFTREELINYNGQNQRPAYIAFHGLVYDVSGSELWREGSHQRVHFAGDDLTPDLGDAPHGAGLLSPFPVVGELVNDT